MKTRIKDFIRDYYGLIAVFVYAAFVTVFLICWGDKLFLCWNDNLDSNVAINKMYYDNNCLIDRTCEIPFLGGVSREILTNGFNIQSVMFGLLPTDLAYAVLYILRIVVSGTGFYYLGRLGKRYIGEKSNENIFALCGIIYSMLGVWPSAFLDFALLPWWLWLSVKLFDTQKLRYLAIMIVLAYHTSFAMLGAFIVMYMGISFLVTAAVRKKWNWKLCIELAVFVIAYMFMNKSHFLMALSGSADQTKGLAQQVYYQGGIVACAKLAFRALLIKERTYHSGAFPLSYVALPVVIVFLYVLNCLAIQRRKLEASVAVFDGIFLMLVINSILYGYDTVWLRQYVPFFSGFSFSRAYWLNPFLIMLLISISMSILAGEKLKMLVPAVIVIIPLTIVFNNNTSKGYDMYNVLNVNYQIYAGKLNGFNDLDWKWDEFYSEKLLSDIKEDIGYNGEWAVGFGLDPAVLQYNQIRTLDGYYSNYDVEYYYKWTKLLKPEFKVDKKHKEYWESSGGLRAYIYSEKWDMPNERGIESVKKAKMRVDKEMLDELGCRYVFSRVRVVNAKDLGLSLVGDWKGQDSLYHIFVYENNF